MSDSCPSAVTCSPHAAVSPQSTPATAECDAEVEAKGLEQESEAQRSANLRPASSAPRHTIESILGFLSLSELTTAIRVCPLWLSAVHHMRSIGDAVSLRTIPDASVLLRHVGALSNQWLHTDADFWNRVAVALPHLHTINSLITLPRAQAIAWPAKLTSLTLDFNVAESLRRFFVPVADANQFLCSLRIPQLQRLTLTLDVTPLAALDLSFLTEHRELTELTLNLQWTSPVQYHLTEKQVEVIRQLTQLTMLRCSRIHSACLQRVLRPPHQFVLASAPTFFSIDERAAECLASLPTLVELNANLCSSVSFLSKLPVLSTLYFDCHRSTRLGGGWLLTAQAVLEGLSPCKGLTSLTLRVPLQSAHMIALLPKLPLLHTLQLEKMSELESLRCFSSGPITSCLTTLALRSCQHVSLDQLTELAHLHELRNLESLEIGDTLQEALTEAVRSDYAPPSRFFPHLRIFDCYRNDDDEFPMVSEVEEEEGAQPQ